MKWACTCVWLAAAGDGAGQSEDEPDHLLPVWSRHRAALPRKDLPPWLPGHRARGQRAADGNRGGSPREGGWPRHPAGSFSTMCLPVVTAAFVFCRRSSGLVSALWSASASSNTLSTCGWVPSCSLGRVWPRASAMWPAYYPAPPPAPHPAAGTRISTRITTCRVTKEEVWLWAPQT